MQVKAWCGVSKSNGSALILDKINEIRDIRKMPELDTRKTIA